ncbi:MAG: hypothetical protein R3Y23_06195 [Bacillota bacterium]
MEVENTGSLAASYMVILETTNDALVGALTITFGGAKMTPTDGVFTTSWVALDVKSIDETGITITFNGATSGNVYENTSFEFDLTVLATQQNDYATAAADFEMLAQSTVVGGVTATVNGSADQAVAAIDYVGTTLTIDFDEAYYSTYAEKTITEVSSETSGTGLFSTIFTDLGITAINGTTIISGGKVNSTLVQSALATTVFSDSIESFAGMTLATLAASDYTITVTLADDDTDAENDITVTGTIVFVA